MSVSDLISANPKGDWLNLNVSSITSTHTLVSQATNISTAVTATGSALVITTQSANSAGGGASPNTFAINDVFIVPSSVITGNILNYAGTYGTNGTPVLSFQSVATGTVNAVIQNAHASNALAGVLKLSVLIS